MIKAESDYYPWGGELQFVNNDSNDYKFTGKKRDTETGLDYFGARYYSNGLGRFLNADWAAKATAVSYAEFGDPQTLNLYSYVRNTPLAKFDLDGHAVQQPSCGTGSSSVCGDIPKNTMGAPTDASSKVTTDTHGEIQCSGNCPSATAIKAGGEAAANTAEFGVTVYAGPVTVSVTPSGANVNAQMIPSVGATVDLTIPKPDDSKGPTASVSTGTKVVGASANIQDGKVTSVTGSAGYVVGPKAAEKIPGGENVSASFGKVIDTIKNIYHSAAQSPQPGEFENLSD